MSPKILIPFLALAVLLSGACSAEVDTVMEPVNLVDFGSGRDWRVINDGVMGGLSRSSILPTDRGTGVFAGELSLENNGGFASVRTVLDSHDLSPYAGLEIRIKGDGRAYQLRLRMNGRMDGIAYRASFRTLDGKWSTARIPFEQFIPSFRGQVVEDAPPLDPSRIQQLGFLIADNKSGPFSLEIDFVQAWNPEMESE